MHTLPLPARIAAELREQITHGVYRPNEKLPSTRALAHRLGVARGSVVTAYEQLIAEGYLVGQHGSGTRVHPDISPAPPRPAPAQPAPEDKAGLLQLTPGLPDTARLITPAWRAAWRSAAADASQLTEQAPAGLAELRREVAAHLRHMRGLNVDPARIMVTAGAREGLGLLLRAVGGRLRVGVESPGYPSLRQIPPALGHALVELPTDDHGLRVPTGLPGGGLDLALITPSHQYPYGGSLPAARRTELVAFAGRHDVLLVEDDFDSELRYAGQPLPALAALGPEQAVLLGTFSSVISPSIACGYLVVPDRLIAPIRQVRAVTGQPVAAITQAALAKFLASGELRRHTGRVRRDYRRRRDLVVSALGPAVRPISGGLHAVVICARPAREVVAAAAERGLAVTALTDYWGGTAADNGIVIGFGHLSDAELASALNVFQEILGQSPAD